MHKHICWPMCLELQTFLKICGSLFLRKFIIFNPVNKIKTSSECQFGGTVTCKTRPAQDRIYLFEKFVLFYIACLQIAIFLENSSRYIWERLIVCFIHLSISIGSMTNVVQLYACCEKMISLSMKKTMERETGSIDTDIYI